MSVMFPWLSAFGHVCCNTRPAVAACQVLEGASLLVGGQAEQHICLVNGAAPSVPTLAAAVTPMAVAVAGERSRGSETASLPFIQSHNQTSCRYIYHI